MAKWLRVAFGILLVSGSSLAGQEIPTLPDSTGWGLHVLALARAPDGALWVGTYGRGIYVLRRDASAWEHLAASRDTAAYAISFDFVHAFAFGPSGEIWYGTVGNGWGLSTDGGKAWRNWEFRDLGPEWQYVAPNGIVAHGETTYIATADGIKVTGDDGRTWAVITDSAGATTATDSVMGRIQNQYVLAIALAEGGNMWVSTLRGLGHSPDGGRTWHEHFPPPPCTGRGCVNRARALLVDSLARLWVGTERGVFRFGAEFGGWKGVDADSTVCRRFPKSGACLSGWPAVQELIGRGSMVFAASQWGVTRVDSAPALLLGRFLSTAVAPLSDSTLIGGSGNGVFEVSPSMRVDNGARANQAMVRPIHPQHTWFRRPIILTDQPYIDQTYRFGSTMGGVFQPHQGVEFNNPDGTPVHAIGDGVVMHAGPAEQGALTVAIRHDRRLRTPDSGHAFLYSVYYHNTKLLVTVGQRVKAGDVIALVGNTGRATNDHLHLEVHALPVDSVRLAVDPEVRYPPYNANPELWIDPLPGTGLLAGQVWDSHGQAVQQARIYGLSKPEPQETPFSFIETYGPRNHSDPVYGEHFAITDVPPGEYVLGVEVEGKRVTRRVRVQAGALTWVVFRPGP